MNIGYVQIVGVRSGGRMAILELSKGNVILIMLLLLDFLFSIKRSLSDTLSYIYNNLIYLLLLYGINIWFTLLHLRLYF